MIERLCAGHKAAAADRQRDFAGACLRAGRGARTTPARGRRLHPDCRCGSNVLGRRRQQRVEAALSRDWLRSHPAPEMKHLRGSSNAAVGVSSNPHRLLLPPGEQPRRIPPPRRLSHAWSGQDRMCRHSPSAAISGVWRATRSINRIRTVSSSERSPRSAGTSSVISTAGSSGGGVPAFQVETAIGA